jgi:hypothetical protein
MDGQRCRQMRRQTHHRLDLSAALRHKRITELPLARLNARLAPRLVACADQDGKVTPYGVFKLRPMSPEAPGRTNGTRGQGD